MVDESLIKRICDYANLNPREDVALEIGAGSGNLTGELVKRSRLVYAIEKDPRLCKILEEKFSGENNFSLIRGDALKMDFPDFNKIVSNIPYGISRDITLKLLKHTFDLGILVVQKEYAQKLTAKPNTGEYRFVSALAQSFWSIELLDDVPKSAFKPVPEVESKVVRIRQDGIPDANYVGFLRRLFNARNKRVGGILKENKSIPTDYADRRPFTLSPAELRTLYNQIY